MSKELPIVLVLLAIGYWLLEKGGLEKLEQMMGSMGTSKEGEKPAEGAAAAEGEKPAEGEAAATAEEPTKEEKKKDKKKKKKKSNYANAYFSSSYYHPAFTGRMSYG